MIANHPPRTRAARDHTRRRRVRWAKYILTRLAGVLLYFGLYLLGARLTQ